MQSRRLLILLAVIFASLVSNGQSTPNGRLLIPQEPTPNLGKLKTRLIAYHNCTGNYGCYTSDLDRQSDLATAILQRRAAAKPGEKLALVLDIDETALSNWDEEMQDDFGYIAKDWNDWVDKKQAPAIAGTFGDGDVWGPRQSSRRARSVRCVVRNIPRDQRG